MSPILPSRPARAAHLPTLKSQSSISPSWGKCSSAPCAVQFTTVSTSVKSKTLYSSLCMCSKSSPCPSSTTAPAGTRRHVTSKSRSQPWSSAFCRASPSAAASASRSSEARCARSSPTPRSTRRQREKRPQGLTVGLRPRMTRTRRPASAESLSRLEALSWKRAFLMLRDVQLGPALQNFSFMKVLGAVGQSMEGSWPLDPTGFWSVFSTSSMRDSWR
mmetsp:Transcript_114668/g.357143  ORF Transcript_114668/g.357143 Transcript_114668/m.357143 type:complete len:218 (+) Transcript_114668:4204-4857(+)